MSFDRGGRPNIFILKALTLTWFYSARHTWYKFHSVTVSFCFLMPKPSKLQTQRISRIARNLSLSLSLYIYILYYIYIFYIYSFIRILNIQNPFWFDWFAQFDPRPSGSAQPPGSPPVPKLSPSASRQSLSSDVSTRTLKKLEIESHKDILWNWTSNCLIVVWSCKMLAFTTWLSICMGLDLSHMESSLLKHLSNLQHFDAFCSFGLRKTSFLGPDDNSEAHAFTLANFILQDVDVWCCGLSGPSLIKH